MQQRGLLESYPAELLDDETRGLTAALHGQLARAGVRTYTHLAHI
jgi:hypothetical protein